MLVPSEQYSIPATRPSTYMHLQQLTGLGKSILLFVAEHLSSVNVGGVNFSGTSWRKLGASFELHGPIWLAVVDALSFLAGADSVMAPAVANPLYMGYKVTQIGQQFGRLTLRSPPPLPLN